MKWIKISEQLPPPLDFVLVCSTPPGDEPQCVAIARKTLSGRWDFPDYNIPDDERQGAYMDIAWPFHQEYIKHWMPLPKPPERE
jgi:hypothetical protein